MHKITNNPQDSILEINIPGTNTVINSLQVSTLETSQKETFRGTNTLAQDLQDSILGITIIMDQMRGISTEKEGMIDTDPEKDPAIDTIEDHKGN